MNKDLIVKKETFFVKIKKFLLNIFSKKNKELIKDESIDYYNNKNQQSNDFLSNIKIDKNKEENMLLHIQQDLENGKINVADIEDEVFNKILDLYNDQILEIKKDTEKLNRSTEIIKQKILMLKKELKA